MTLNFFDDILIPNHLFPTETVFDSTKSQWVWKFIDEDDPSLNSDMPLEIGAKVKFDFSKITVIIIIVIIIILFILLDTI